MFTQRGGLEVNFESGGSAEDHVKAVPGTKIKSKMIMTNVSDDPVMLEHMDTLFHIEGLSFDATRVLPFFFRRAGGRSHSVHAHRGHEAVFVFRCETRQPSGHRLAPIVRQTVHPKYKQELQQLMSGGCIGGSRLQKEANPEEKPEPEGEEVGEERGGPRKLEQDRLQRGQQVQSARPVPELFVRGRPRRFEMLEGLVHQACDAGSGLAAGTAGPPSSRTITSTTQVLWMDGSLKRRV